MIATTFYLVFQLALLVWVWSKLVSCVSESNKARLGLLVLLVLCVSIPVNELPVLFYLRGFFGEISVATLVYSALFLIKQVPGFSEARSFYMAQGLAIVLLLGLLLYPASLGLGPFDVYALGFGTRAMVIIFVVTCFICILLQNWLMLGILWFGVVFYLLKLLPSDNLWDYWIDPIIWIISIIYAVSHIKRISSGRSVANQ